jgi:hypothetical protein
MARRLLRAYAFMPCGVYNKLADVDSRNARIATVRRAMMEGVPGRQAQLKHRKLCDGISIV